MAGQAETIYANRKGELSMATETHHDVIVIGGGPAGSSAATFLSKQGHQVLLLEKEKFPRDHVGESLLPFCHNLFEQLGVLEQMKETFVRKPGVRFIDSDGSQSTTWCFDKVIHDHTYLSFQVGRGDFDKLLLDNARRHGATVLEETRVTGVALDGPDGTVSVQASGPDGQTANYAARFLMDCSGRDAYMATRQRLKKKYAELDRTALWTHYGGAPLRGGLEEGLSLIIYMGGDKKGWLWIFPLGPNRLTVGVVLNNAYIRTEKAKLEQLGVEDWRLALYEQELSYSRFARELLANAEMLQPLVVEGDYSYYTESKYGENYAMVGDAATFIDPIFSSGVYLAINGARKVSQGVHRRLTMPEEGNAGLVEAYKSIEGAYKMVFKLITFFYSVNTINFAQMEAVSDTIHQQHQDAMSVGHFLLAGDFFERYDEYSKVIDALQSPSIFSKYKKLVSARPSLQDTSCDVSPDLAFHRLRVIN